MRDHETISLALTAAETGHLVFGTLHSSSAAKTIDRIIDVFPTGDKEMVRAMLSSSIQGVVAQTLLRRTEGGRIGAFEILVGTNAVRNLIRENQVPQIFSMMQTGSRYGMITMEDAVRDLLESGMISEEEAHRALLKSSDESASEGDSGEYASASLGGGRTDGRSAEDESQHVINSDGSGDDKKSSDGGYSF